MCGCCSSRVLFWLVLFLLLSVLVLLSLFLFSRLGILVVLVGVVLAMCCSCCLMPLQLLLFVCWHFVRRLLIVVRTGISFSLVGGCSLFVVVVCCSFLDVRCVVLMFLVPFLVLVVVDRVC